MIGETQKVGLYTDPLPEHWRLTAIGDLAVLMTNGFVGIVTPHQVKHGGVIYIQSYNVRENRIDLADVTYVTREFSDSQSKSMLREGDLLTVQSGHVGTSAVVPKDLSGVNCHALIITRFREGSINPQFVAQYLNSSLGKKRLRGLHVGSSLAHINTKDLKQFLIPVPPRVEQDRIAQIADVWDRAIDLTIQLIAAAQQRKQGLMQRLLVGRQRFKEFTDMPWTSLKAGEIFQPHSQRNNGDEELLSVTQEQGVLPRSMLDGRVVMPAGETTSYKLVEPGDFIISLRSFQGGIEYSQYLGLVSPAYTVLKPRRPVVDGFYKHLFKSRDFIARLGVAIIGIRDGKQISFEDFSAIRLAYPAIDEQRRIAEVLDACDEEIALLTHKLALLKQQKQGLMQKLLTGKVRVPA